MFALLSLLITIDDEAAPAHADREAARSSP
jgi:hypothetical protein